MMLALFASLCLTHGSVAAHAAPQSQGTLESMQHALADVKQRGDTYARLYHDPVGPRTWIDSSRLFYCATAPDGTRNWWLVDASAPSASSRTPLFDHAEVSKIIRSIDGSVCDPDRLPLKSVVVKDCRVEITVEGIGPPITRPLALRSTSDTATGAHETHDLEPVDALDGQKESPRDGATAAEAPSASALERGLALEHDGANVVLRAKGTEVFRTSDGADGDAYSGGEWLTPAQDAFVLMKVKRGQRHPVRVVEASPSDQLEPKLRTRQYQKPGDAIDAPMPHLFRVEEDANAPVGLRVREIAVNQATFANMWSIDRVRFLPRVEGRAPECAMLCNTRGHQAVSLLALNLIDGSTRVIAEEKFATFVDYTNKIWLHWLDSSGEVLWMSERDGWNHLYLIDVASGAVKRQITHGDWLVRRVHDVDANARTIDIALMGREPLQDPYHVHHARVRIDTDAMTMLTSGDGTCRVDFSPDRSALVCVRSRADLPPVYELRRCSDGAVVCELGAGDARALRAAGWTWPQRFVAKGRDGVTPIYGLVYRPTNFDASKKYPVIEQIYAGPHGQHVSKWFDVWSRAREYAELGAIVVQIDGMGTNWRSKAFHDVCWKNLKDSGFPDRIAWIKALAEHDSSLDLSRVGIFGGSAGGQSAMRAVIDHADFYSVAAADCGCHDNRMDKIWWNEQWLGWPIDESYTLNSNLVDAAKLGGALMLSVGGMDENVDPATTMQVAQALIDAGRDFELLVIPDGGHGCAESPYGNARRARFLFEKLGASPAEVAPVTQSNANANVNVNANANASANVNPPKPESTRPNIVFVMSDDHCKQAISCYGASAAPDVIATPGIDRLAREGMRFDRSSVTNAICGPSRAVMLTGKHSHMNGFARNDQRFDNTQVTFPKLLQAAGYRTEVVGKWHLESEPTGFDYSDVLLGQGDYWNPQFSLNGTPTKREGHVTDIIHARAVERLGALAQGAKEGTPFALLVHHKAPHRNWMPQPRYFELFKGITIPEPPTLFDRWTGRSVASSMQTMQVDRDLSWEYDLKVPARRLFPEGKLAQLDQWMANELSRLPVATREAVESAYRSENEALFASMSTMDAHAQTSWKFQRYAKDYLRTAQGVDDSVGGILAELDRLGLSDNTIVVYTSDQGWFLGEHGWFDKRWMYEESFRMPLLVRWPGHVKPASVSSALVQNLDFAPTFLDAAGVAIPAQMQGKSMLPLLQGAEADAAFRDAVYYRFEESTGPHTVPRHEGVATAHAKLIHFLDIKDSAGGDPTGGTLFELYDLDADADEMIDRSHDPKYEALRMQLETRLDELRWTSGAPLDGTPMRSRAPASKQQ